MALRRSLRSWCTIVVVSILGLGVAPGLAQAHTELDYSLPADGTSVGEPVDEIVMSFTSPVSLVGDGFRVLDPQNQEFSPVVVTDDDTLFRLQFDPPLAGGTVAVRYEVRADDGHVVAGHIVFDVDAPQAGTAPSTTLATTTPATTTPATTTRSSTRSTTTTSTSTPAVAPATVAETAPHGTAGESIDDPAGDGGEDDGGAGNVVALAAVAALAVVGFVLVRSRTST